jgi:hypothetical protein
MSMKRSQRGAARVSVIWVVAFGVLFLVGIAIGFFGLQEATKAKQEAEAARASSKQAEEQQSEARKKVTDLSKAVGWYDPAASAPASDLTAMQSSMTELKAAFPDLGPDVTTVAAALPVIQGAYAARAKEIATLTDAKTKLEGEKKALEDSLRDALRQKDTELGNVQKQLGDDANTATQRQSELERSVATLTTQRNELDTQLRESRGSLDKANRDFEGERQTWETKRKADRAVLKFQEQPAAADGRVLSVSKDLSLGWINIGSKNRLARGMRFDVRSGAPGEQPIKARAEVTETKADMAEVLFYDVVDRFDPVVAGDVIFNPLYDPTGERRAVLIGRFSGQFNEAELKVLLANMAITVEPKLSFDTDYLIVGSEMYVDENGQPLEEPLQPSELPTFKDAEAQGVQIVSIDALRTYFKF